MTAPKYYYLVFGNPEPPEKDEVESGIYHPKARPPFLIEPGDLLLLYCTGNYAAHPMQVPGLGVALRIDSNVVEYRYLPLARSIPRDKLLSCFEDSDRAYFNMINLNAFSLRDMSRKSFAAAVEGASIVWP